jgi:CubicO group peptidase (beta-lactamase class C family)
MIWAAPPSNRSLCRDGFKDLDPLIEEQIHKRAFPGAALAVGYRGNLVFQKGYGKLDYWAKAPAVTNETIYDLASLTKVITATTLAMQLYERGQLKLDHPVSRYFPGFVGEGRDKITIRHLLTHTSGLPAHLPLYKDLKGKAAFVEKILQVPLESTPGTKAVYSDLGLILLGDILEKLAAKPLDSSLRVSFNLGMKHCFKPKPQWKDDCPTEVILARAPATQRSATECLCNGWGFGPPGSQGHG